MKRCQHENCGCRITDDTAVERAGQLYCSIDCAEGRGCTHANCGCRNPSQSDQRDHGKKPDPQKQSATNPANRNDPTKPAPAHNPGHHTSFNPAQGGPAIRNNTEAGKRD